LSTNRRPRESELINGNGALMWRTKSLDASLENSKRNPLLRSLGPVQLTLFGVGSTIGTGIFVLTAQAAQEAGPGMIVSFVLAAVVCGIATLCYAELAAMAPVSGAAYVYVYASFGELWAWIVGWALVLEYAISASAVAVGWSGYLVGLLEHSALHVVLPAKFTNGPYAGGVINIPAVLLCLVVTLLLVIGTQESARVNAVFVTVKVLALGLFVIMSLPAIKDANFHPFAPLGAAGITNAAASIFFTFIGFDAVATAAEETRNPQRNLPIGLFGALLVVTLIYLLVAIGATGTYGAQPMRSLNGTPLLAGSKTLTQRCEQLGSGAHQPLVCSHEALAYVLRQLGHPAVAGWLGIAAFIALPSVVMMLIYGQTRIFFVMSRDGLIPCGLARIHSRWKTPYIVTLCTGAAVALASAFLPVGRLAAIANSGTLFAFFLVSLAVLRLRYTEPDRNRPFRTPAVWFVASISCLGCLVLFLFLSREAKLVLPLWSAVGLMIYGLYGLRRSRLASGGA